MSRFFLLLVLVCIFALSPLASAQIQQQGNYTGAYTAIPIPYAAACQNARGLAVDSSSNIYVACGTNSSIMVLDQSGNNLRNITYTHNGVTWSPFGIAFSGNNMYVTSLWESTIYQIATSSSGQPTIISSWTTGLYWPWGVAVDGSGNVWVANYGAGSVLQFSSGGSSLLKNFTTTGPAMNFPEEIAIDSSNNILVVDTDNNRVVKFNQAGSVVATYSNTNPRLIEPGGIAIDTQGSIYVCDTWNYAVIKLDSNGVQAEVLANGQGGTGQAKISAAAGLAIDSVNQVYVLDSLSNNRILKFPATLFNNTGYYGQSSSTGGNGQSAAAAVSGAVLAAAAAVTLALL